MITRLFVERIRNLSHVDLKGELKRLNVFYGANGSGKSSLLESVFILVSGRSFRTSQLKQYIQHGQADAVIFAEVVDSPLSTKLGLQKWADGRSLIKVNGEQQPSMAAIAQMLPVQVIDPIGLSILDDGSNSRRQLFDWLMFHVEPLFYPTWLNYQRVLKQRNTLIKQHKISRSPIQPSVMQGWEQQLAQYGTLIHTLRQNTLHAFDMLFQQLLTELLPNIDISIHYLAGFHTDNDPTNHQLTQAHFIEQLAAHRHTDLDRGFTFYGPHRADIKLKTDGGYAEHVLSRGQKKLLIIAFKLAQLQLLHRKNKASVVLLDDISAELDVAALNRLLHVLNECQCQIFMTCLDANSLHAPLSRHFHPHETSFFHVQQGSVYPVDALGTP